MSAIDPANPVHAVLFDLDGTLVDSAPDLAGAANELRAAHGLPPLALAQLLLDFRRQRQAVGQRSPHHFEFSHPESSSTRNNRRNPRLCVIRCPPEPGSPRRGTPIP